MNKDQKDNKNKLLVLTIGGVTALGLVCSGLYSASFANAQPVVAINLVLSSIICLGTAIASAVKITDIYNKMQKNDLESPTLQQPQAAKGKAETVKIETPNILNNKVRSNKSQKSISF